MSTFDYRIFSLNIRSDLRLTGHVENSFSGQPDIVVRRGRVPETLTAASDSGVLFESKPGELLLKIPKLSRILVREGREILYTPHHEAELQEAALPIVGSGFGALLHQRGALALHGSCVLAKDGAVAFLGDSGAGKSTIAAGLTRRGCSLVTDDILAITFQDGVPMVLPCRSDIKLWKDCLQAVELSPAKHRPVRTELPKYLTRLSCVGDEPYPLQAIYILPSSPTSRLKVERPEFSLIQKTVPALLRYTYQPRYLKGLGKRGVNLRDCGLLAQRVALKTAKLPWSLECLDELADAILADLGATA